MIEIEEGSGNVYTDFGAADADEMLVKEQLATRIGEIIKGRKWSQLQAAEVLGIPQSKLSTMLRGQFRGISEAKTLDHPWPGSSLTIQHAAHPRLIANGSADPSRAYPWRECRNVRPDPIFCPGASETCEESLQDAG